MWSWRRRDLPKALEGLVSRQDCICTNVITSFYADVQCVCVNAHVSIVYPLSHDGVRTMMTGYELCILKMSSLCRMEGSWTVMQLPSLLKVHIHTCIIHHMILRTYVHGVPSLCLVSVHTADPLSLLLVSVIIGSICEWVCVYCLCSLQLCFVLAVHVWVCFCIDVC